MTVCRTYCAILLCFLAMLRPTVSRAQTLGLAPAQVVQKFKPGVPFEFDLATANNGDNPVEMHVEISDLWYHDKGEKTFPAPGSTLHSAANWIQFVPEHFEIAAHATAKMKAIATPPSNVSGGFYAVLFVTSKPQLTFDKTKDGKQIFTNMRLGCLVLLSAEGTEDYKIEVSNLQLNPPSANQGLELTFDVTNFSNTHVFPIGRVAVLDSNRKLVAKAQSDMIRLLPGQKNSLHVDWSGSLPAGPYTAVLTVTYGEDRIETQQIPFNVIAP